MINNISNTFVEELPCDFTKERISRQVLGACSSLIDPEAVKNPKLLAWSEDLAHLFKMSKPYDNSLELKILSGNHITQEMKPYSACYGGHQFGHWAGQLGDGRAITLGEVRDIKGESWDLQLKGAGQTPYSRNADGRAVLRSSLREFLASEAMFHLGIPTTRALSLVSTGDLVMRDMLYDGNSKFEAGAITARMAPSFLRFGNYEIQARRQQTEILKKLVDWTICRHFKIIELNTQRSYSDFFTEVCKRTALLIVEWERVGFVHGVMNTDNMSILGLGIDYGPFGWLDGYDPQWTPNTTDRQGRRYCFGNQASIAYWNLQCLAQALSPLISDHTDLEIGLNIFIETYKDSYLQMMKEKLGLISMSSPEDIQIIPELDHILQLAEVDWTIFFRSLATINCAHDLNEDSNFNYLQIKDAIYGEPSLEFITAMTAWLMKYAQLIRREKVSAEDRVKMMNKKNPKFIPRNYLLYQVIQDLEIGNSSSFEDLYSVLKNPYNENTKFNYLALKRPDWAKNTVGSSMLSCSS